jgi:amino acid transporter
MSEQVTAPPPIREDGELRRGSLGFFGVLAQSVAMLAPSAAIAVLVGLVVGSAGAGSWLSWAITTAIMLTVGYCIAHFTRRLVTTGNLYGLATKGAGSGVGLLVGWAQVAFGIISGPAFVLGFGIYFAQLLSNFGVSDSRWMMLLWFVLAILLASWFAYRDVRLSARMMLFAEAISIVVLTVLMFVTLAHTRGSIIDHAQLHLTGVSFHSIVVGVVLATFAFAGFESCATLGQEAKAPYRTIPRSVLVSVALAGLFFVFCSYVTFLGYAHQSKYTLATDPAPLADLARIDGVAGFRYVVLIGVVISAFSVITAVLNQTSRMLFTMSREGLLPKQFSHVDASDRTPKTAILILAAVDIATVVVLTIGKSATIIVYGNIATLASYEGVWAYLLIALVTLVFLRRRRQLRPIDAVIALAAAAALGYVYYNTVHPMPPSPADVYLDVFFGSVAASLLTWAVLAFTKSKLLSRVGTSVDVDTSAAGHLETTTPAAVPDASATALSR